MVSVVEITEALSADSIRRVVPIASGDNRRCLLLSWEDRITMNAFRNYWLAGLGIFLLFASVFAAAPSGAPDSKLVRLHIPGYSPNSLPFQIADDLGFYKEEGITVDTLRMKTGAGG